MKVRYLIVTALAVLLLSGCATYGYRDGYRGGSGDYYYGRTTSSGYYGAPYGSVGYGRYGGVYGSVGYGYPGGYSRYSYWPRGYYGSYGGYYPPYYHGRPIVRPRPDNDRPRDNRPNAPWRNLQGVTRVEHRERPQRIHRSPAGMRTQGQRDRVQPSIPSNRQDTQRSRNSPWRAGPARGTERSRATPAPARQSAPVQRVRSAPARPAPKPRARDSDRRRSIEP